jgi:hypothetical protein
VLVAGAAVAATVATPAALIANAPGTTTDQVVLAGNGNVHGSGGGGAGGGGGCGNGPGWHGWDGVRGWGHF